MQVNSQGGGDLGSDSGSDLQMVTSFIDWDGSLCFLNILDLNVYEGHEALEKRAYLVESF